MARAASPGDQSIVVMAAPATNELTTLAIDRVN
jgi:hypothetical protein